VEHRWLALARVAAGWVCLMAAVAAFVLWMLLLALATGGNVTGTETLHVLPLFPDAQALDRPSLGGIDPAALQAVRWTPTPALWLVPFTAATGMYVLASALAVGVRHPLRWIVGTLLGMVALSGVADVVGGATDSRWLVLAPSRVLSTLLYGPYGIDTLMTGRSESLRTVVTLTDGRQVPVWRGLPDVGEWASATLAWTAAGLVLLWLAASRHRERRRR
jgi:hypothetical protein